jgi:hypothetical protein
MIQLHVLTGGEAGKRVVAKKFPFKVGRHSGNSLVLSDPGVFAEHFEIDLTSEGFALSSNSDAVVTINSNPGSASLLRNGDVIGCGLAKLQFWLAELPQRGLKVREMATWALIALVAGGQVYLLVRLLEIARS